MVAILVFNTICQILYIFTFFIYFFENVFGHYRSFSIISDFVGLSTLKFDLKTSIFIKRNILEARFSPPNSTFYLSFFIHFSTYVTNIVVFRMDGCNFPAFQASNMMSTSAKVWWLQNSTQEFSPVFFCDSSRKVSAEGAKLCLHLQKILWKSYKKPYEII